MKTFPLLLAAGLALASLGTPAFAVTFQVVDDTYGSTVNDKITKAAGKATTLPVSAKSTAFISFGVGSSGIDPSSVTGARLVIYFPAVTKAGSLTLSANAAPGFTEAFTTPTITAPASAGAIGGPIAITTAEAKNFLTIDITPQVVSWLSNEGTDFGIAVSGDATLKATIGAKEGSGSGYPAVLEVDVNDSSAGTVAGSSGSFNSFVTLDLSEADNGTLAGGLVFGGPPSGAGDSGEGIASDRVGTSSHPNAFGLDFYTDYTQRLSITQTGNVGIGTTAPLHTLQVNGNVMMGTENPTMPFTELGDSIYLGSGRKYLSNTLGAPINGNTDWLNLMCHPFSAGILFGCSGPSDSDPHSAPTPLMVIESGGNVGIGTTAPTAPLNIALAATEVKAGVGSSAPSLGLELTNTTNDDPASSVGRSNEVGIGFDGGGGVRQAILGGTFNKDFLDFYTFGDLTTPKMHIDTNVGIGTTTPSAKLEVNGGIKCIGAVDTSSDARYKLNIQPLSGALAQTLRLRGVSYDWNRAQFPEKAFDDRHQLGFVAQEVREILPDVVSEDREGYLSIGYTAIIPVLAEAVKELKQQDDAKLAALAAENAALAQKLTALEARDAAREARLTKLENALEERPAHPVTAALDLK